MPAPPIASLLLLQAGAVPPPAPDAGSAGDGPARELSESVITPTLSAQSRLDAPWAEDVITAEQLERRAYRTVPQALRDTPGIFVQETAVGQGSPYIRGFTGYQNLLLIDGIRLNNSVFRSGPNQYWNTIDPYTIGSMEVVLGPSSVVHGSDSLGGTVNVLTRNPYAREGRTFGGQLFYRGSTAEQSTWGRAEYWATAGNTGVLMGVGGKHFGDLIAGSGTGEQPDTGYSQLDGDMKVETFIDPDTRLVFAYQHVAQNEVPRTHKTVNAIPFEGSTVGSELRRDLDQRRTLVYGQLHGEQVDSWFDRYSLSLSWHQQEEERHRLRTGGYDEQGFTVDQVGLLANLSSDTGLGRLTYGFDLYHDEVDSFSSTNPIQGPVADDSSYDLLGVFIQDELEVTERLDLVLGGRFNLAAADAGRYEDPVTGNPASLEDDFSALVGSARFLYELEPEQVHLYGGVSQGFRAPGLSDLTRLDSSRSNELEVASPGLEPEYTTTYELGLKTESAVASTRLSAFYTEIRDGIIRTPTGNTVGTDIEVVKSNVGDGYVTGLELGGAWEFARDWTLFGNAAYQYGEQDTFPTSAPVIERETITRMMPLMAQVGLLWELPGRDLWVEGQLVYADDADRLNTRDQADTQRIPPGGTPGYLIANLRGGWQVTDDVVVDLALDNLGDVNYRVHGSGQNMPGFNVILGLRVSL